MKRRIVRITAGTLFVLAWVGAGVYAFWSPKRATDEATPPPVTTAEMSKQIAQVNLEAEKAAKKKTGFAPTEMKSTGGPPTANPLFSASKSTNSFKPKPNAFQPPADVPETTGGYGDTPAVEVVTPQENHSFAGAAAGSVYGASEVAGAVGDEQPVAEPNPNAVAEGTEVAPPTAFENAGNPLRGRTLQPPAELPAEAGTAAEPGTLAGPPGRFEAAAEPAEPEAALEPTPAARGGGFGTGGSRFPAIAADAAAADALAEHNGASPAVAPLPSRTSASARPGDQALEGAQAPSLVIEKFAPPEIQVGKPATFEIHVRNAGQTTAQQVMVSDHVPAGTKLVDAKPQPQAGADGSLVWQLGTMEAGAEKTITLQLMPQKEGEIGSVAHVTFAATASAKTICTKPMLTVEHVAPAKVMIGEPVTLQITISNPGTGVATGIVLQEDVPEGLAHSAGKELEYEVGTLRPGESKKLELTLEAAKAGMVQNTLHVRGEGSLSATHSTQLEVIAPQLEVAMNGPKRRYLDRQATYTVSINNPGTASARDVEIVAYLPKGMKFVSTDHEGQYDPTHHAVYWSLEELPASQKGSAQLVAIPIEPGEQKLRVEGHAKQGLNTSDEETVQVEAIPQLVFEIVDEADPIEVGAETVYQVRVTNVGSKAATNVQVAAGLPPELRPVSADGATRGGVQGQNVIFEPLGKLAPQAEALFKIQATGLRTGDFTIRVQITSDELQTPVTKEEHTKVYADR